MITLINPKFCSDGRILDNKNNGFVVQIPAHMVKTDIAMSFTDWLKYLLITK